ncbi:MAG: hypothetical protein ABFC96_01595 [Thermoguttaceae bacterium]
MANKPSVLLIGGPDAGKTNYLGRLWIAINSNTGLLRKDGLPDDLAYLEEVANKLLQGRFAPHTPRGQHNSSFIPFTSAPETGPAGGTLAVPDCFGEKWMDVCRKREWSNEWEELISEDCGCLVFLRVESEQIVPALDPITCAGYALQGDAPVSAGSAIPTQVVLIEWLQFLRQAFTGRVRGSYRPRVGIVVTAWDLVPADAQSELPSQYLSSNFPMLGQFLEANPAAFDFAYFGVSVVAGELDPKKDPDFRQVYIDGNPREAGYVVHSVGGVLQKSGDLTLPVAWALRIC